MFSTAVGFSRFGNELYSLDHICAAGYKQFSRKWSGGVKFEYLNERYGGGYENRARISSAIVLMFPLTSKIDAAFQISDPIGYMIKKGAEQGIDNRAIQVGLKSTISKVIMAISLNKYSSLSADVTFGMIYSLTPKFKIRSGLSTGVHAFAFGFGYEMNAFSFTISSSYHLSLGFSPSVSLNWRLAKVNS